MSNVGLGVGAFMQGLTGGMSAMQGYKRAETQQKLADMQMQDMQDERNAKQGYKDLAAQGMTDAKSHTDGQIDNVMNYYMKNTAPKLQQYWLQNGDVQKADAFGKWIQDQNVQQGMRYSAAFMRSAQLGDAEGAMNNLVKMYNQPGYFEDGMSAVNAKILRDKQGNNAGMEITLRNDKTGETSTTTFNSMADVYKLGMQFAAPESVFNYGMEQLKAGQTAAAANAKEQRDWQRTVAGKQLDQNYKLEAQGNESQLRMAENADKARNGNNNPEAQRIQARISAFKAAGKTDEWIANNMTQIVGIENRSRPITSRIDDYIKLKTENDTKFRKLSQDEQIREAQQYIEKQDSLTGAEATTPGLGVPPGMKPAQTQQQPQGDIYFDSKTGQLITR